MKDIITISLIIIIFSSCEDILSPDEDTGDIRDKIVDTWSCEENSSIFKSATGGYYVDISKDPDDSLHVIIDNFYQLGIGEDIKALLDNNKLYIQNQTIDDHLVNGTGTISRNHDEINWTYTVEHPDEDIDNVTAVYTRM